MYLEYSKDRLLLDGLVLAIEYLVDFLSLTFLIQIRLCYISQAIKLSDVLHFYQIK